MYDVWLMMYSVGWVGVLVGGCVVGYTSEENIIINCIIPSSSVTNLIVGLAFCDKSTENAHNYT